jgi:hypothetical protein
MPNFSIVFLIERLTMDSEAPTKSCPLCFSIIDARARKCPYCHVLQGPLRKLIMALCVLAIFFIFALLIYNTRPGRYRYTEHIEDVKIVDSEMYFSPLEMNDTGTMFTIIGHAKNVGDKPISTISLQVEVFDEQHKLVDFQQDSIYSIVAPGSEIPFKIRGSALHLPEAEYKSHKITVLNAQVVE